MKKIKNTECNENDSALLNIKIKKKKPKSVKNLKSAVEKTGDQNFAPMEEGSSLKPKNESVHKLKKKKLSAKKAESQEFKRKKPSVSNDESKPDKQKSEDNKMQNPQADTSSDERIKIILKKKAIKLEKKMKRKEENSECKVLNKPPDSKTNGEIKRLGADATKILDATGSKVLTKKEKKAEKRTDAAKILDATGSKVLTKEEKKAEKRTDAAKILDATGSKVLTKKEKKAEKRKLIKDQKLAEKQTRDPIMEASTVFVGNLPVNTKRVQLLRLFEKFAPVNAIRIRSACGKVMHKHKERKKAGSLNAYVVLTSAEKAEKALCLNGVEFKDNHLRVTLAAKGSIINDKEGTKTTVFVGNLKYSATEESLREIFSSCGEIDYIRCLRDGDKGCKGVAYVCFKTSDAVGLGLELNGTIVDERPINVERFTATKLGAKEAREARAATEQKAKSGAKQRIDNKKWKKDNSGHNNNDGELGGAKKPKKSEFRGVKVEGLKRKQKPKKKKSNNQMLQLAKKIAPKIKTD